MTTQEALEERLEALTEELVALKAAAEASPATSSSSAPARKLENLDLDTYPTADKKLAALDAWVVRAERVFRSRKLRDAKLTEDVFTDELCDFVGKSATLKTYLTTLWRLAMPSALAAITARHHNEGQGRASDVFVNAKEDDDDADADAATTASKETVKEPPRTIGALYNIVLKLYRFKPTGVDALKEFNDARQKTRTPSEYIAYLQELASKTLHDIRVEALTDEQVFFKFKSTLWIDIQRGITAIKERDILDGKTDRNLDDLDEYVRVAEYVHDTVKSDDAKKNITKKYPERSGASSSGTGPIGGKPPGVNNALDKRIAELEKRLEAKNKGGTDIPNIGYVAVKYADLPAEKKEAIVLFQKKHKPPLRDTADKESAKRLGLCFKCVQYGHIASNCKAPTSILANTSKVQVNSMASDISKNDSG